MGTHQAERAVALLRMVSGLWLLRGALAEVVWTPWPWVSPGGVQASAGGLAGHALSHPSPWVRYLIQQFLLPHAEGYAGAMLDLRLLAGVSLLFGLFTVLGAALGLAVTAVQGLLGYYAAEAVLGLHVFQGAAMVVFLITRAGRRWGLDAMLAGLRSRAVLW